MRRRPFGVRVIAVAFAVALGAITLPLVSVLAASVPGLGPALTSPAAAAAPLSCVAPSMYNVDASGNLYSLNVTSLANTVVATNIGSGSVNALGISADGTTAYTTNNTVTGNSTTVTVYNVVAGTKASFAGQTVTGTASIIAGGVDPVNGNYYYGGWNGAGMVFNLFVFNATAHTTSLVGTLTPNVAGQTFSNGDLVFDASGNVVVLAGSNANVAKLVAVTAATLAGASGGALAFTTLSTITSTVTENYVGIAFDTSSTLFVETLQGLLFSVNANSGASTLLGSQTPAGIAPRDLASCTFNGTLTAQKNIVGRAVAGDQFTLTITGNNITSGNTGTTSGNTTGPQGGTAVAGPVVGVPGASYTVTETGATNTSTGQPTILGDYVTTYSCVNGSTPVTSGTGTVATIPSFPQPSGSSGAAVVCTFTNSPATLTITKATSTASYSAVGDLIHYTYTVMNAGPLNVNNITVTDNPIAPAGPLTPPAPTCPAGGGNGSFNLTPGSSVVCTGTYVVRQADLDNGSVNDTSTATGSVGLGGPITAVSNQVTVPAVRSDSISVTKTPSPAFVTAAGQNVTYTFTVTNTGNQTLTNVGVSDVPALNATATCTGRTNPTATCSGTTTTLLPNQVATFTGTYTVTTANFAAGSFTDTATASGTPPGGGAPVTATATATVNTAKIAVTKTANPTTVTAAGQTVTYTFAVTNTGTVALSNVGVTDAPVLATGPTCTGLTNPTATCSGTTVPLLAPGQVATFTGTYIVTPANFAAGSFIDTATASGTPPGAASPITATATATVNTGKITLTKTASPTTVTAAGQTVTYTFAVTNTGTVALSNVGVTDAPALATGPTCTGLTNPTATCSGTTVPTLAPNQVATFSGTYIVTQANMDAGSFTDTGTASGTPTGLSSPITATSMATVNATPAPAIAVTKTPSPTFVTAAGQTVTYTFTVTNTGNQTLSSVGVADVPALNATATCTGRTNPTAACSGTTTTLAPGQVATFSGTYTVTPANFTTGSFTDTATASGTPPGSTTPVTSTAMATVNTAKITLTKTASPTTVTAAGQTVTYTFVVTNTGTVPLTNVGVTDAPVLATGPTCTGLTNPTAACSGTTVPTLAPGQVATFTGTYTVTPANFAAGSFTDTATASGTPPGTETPITATATATVNTAKISVTKTANPTVVTAAGQTVAYTFVVTNTGTVALSNVGVTDAPVLATGPTCTGLTNPTATCSGTTVPSLAPGQVATFSGTYIVTPANFTAGSFTDTATASGTPPGTETPITATATATVNTGKITLLKTANPTTVTAAGQTVTYTFAVTNTGTVALSNVGVTDAPALATGPTCTGLTNPTATCSGPTVPTLAPNQVATFSGTYIVTQANMDAGSFTDTGTASGTPTGLSSPITATSMATVDATQTSSIAITKTPSPSTVSTLPQTVTYTFGVTNTGNTTLNDVDVTDAQTAPSLDVDLGPITCGTDTNGSFSLAPQGTATCTAPYTVTQADIDHGSIADTGTVTGTTPGGGTVTDSAPATVMVTPNPAISITKTANPTTVTAAGQTVTYTFAVENTGNQTLTNVDVTDLQGSPSENANLGPITCGTDTNGSFTLAPLGTASCTAPYTVTQADIDNGSITDTGTATGTTPAGGTVNDSDMATVDATQTSSIAITKTPSPSAVSTLPQTVTYTFGVTNTGNTTLNDVDVTDAQTAPSLDADLGPITCGTDTNGSFSLAPQGTATCTAPYTVTQADIDHGSIADTGTVTGTTPGGGTVTDSAPATVMVTPNPAISITKTANPTTVTAAGQTVTYTFAVENTGNQTLTNVDVTDLQGSPSENANLGPITCGTDTNGSFTLAPLGTASCTAPYTVTQADIDNGSITDTGTATGTTPAGGTVNDSDMATVDATQTSSIAITKTPSPSAVSTLPQTVTYTFGVTNTGNTTLNDVDVTDAQTAPSLDADLGPITCGTDTNGSFSLAPQGTATCTAPYTVTQADIDHGSIADTGTVTGTTPGGGTVTDSAPATVMVTPNPAISITKTANPTTVTAAGQTVTYTFAVENTGNQTLTNVDVTDLQGSPSENANLGPITCGTDTNGSFTLAPLGTASCTAPYTVTQADIDNGSITDTGTATGTTPAGGTVNDSDMATVDVDSISVTKAANVTTVSAVGQSVTYTFTVTNAGDQTLSDVGVSDVPALDATATCTGLTNPTATCSGATTTLDPGQVATFSGTYTVTQADLSSGSLKDTATATGNPPEGSPVTASASLTLLVTQLTVTKAASPAGGVVAGSSTPIVYTITVMNTGTAATTDPTTVTDAAPTGTTLLAGSPACATGGPPTCTVALSGSTITWTIPAGVAPGASYTLTFSVTANASDATGTITNTASWNDPNCATPAVAGGANTPHATTTTCPTNTTSTPVTTDAVVTPTPPPATPAATTPHTATPSNSTALAFTGALLSREWMMGTAAILLGFGLVVVAHRRRHRPRHAMVKK